MSGKSAMSVRLVHAPLEGCDAEQSALAHAFATTLVRCCAAVIEGTKPAALFSFRPPACDCGNAACRKARLRETIAAYARELPLHGLDLTVLGHARDRVQLLVWRSSLVEGIVRDPELSSFLEASGYRCGSASELVGCFRHRLAAFHLGIEPRFPHEVGVLLGYPLEDVRGYISGGRETCRGPWKAYGSASEARRRFGRVAASEACCRRRFASGLSLAALLS
ncbi:DUF3793 family protein [Olsenella sp. DNF00959]|uniref:DUF3793 family protein n=1 Tax=Olsenella sp. DNF00959 TaxID=1476999 RepID=UPI00079AFB60|nr:DUF3793 family protein [Olsenella sp. DNF00959]KXB63726.1 hypothetical protein HMPREF1868_00236 [Olsenella sp. DNF00959]